MRNRESDNTHCQQLIPQPTETGRHFVRCGEPVTEPGSLYCDGCSGVRDEPPPGCPPSADSNSQHQAPQAHGVMGSTQAAPFFDGPGEPSRPLSRTRPSPNPLPGRRPDWDAKVCGKISHLEELEKAGVCCTNFCLVCAIDYAVTIDWPDPTVRDDADQIREWAMEEASIGRHEAEELAKLALHKRDVFLGRYKLACLKAMGEYLDRAVSELSEAHSALADLPRRYYAPLRMSNLGLELGTICSQVKSALALLRELAK